MNDELKMLSVIAAVLVFLGWGCWKVLELDYEQAKESCGEVCAARHSTAVTVTRYGCQCADGAIFQEKAESAAPVFMPVPVVVSP